MLVPAHCDDLSVRIWEYRVILSICLGHVAVTEGFASLAWLARGGRRQILIIGCCGTSHAHTTLIDIVKLAQCLPLRAIRRSESLTIAV